MPSVTQPLLSTCQYPYLLYHQPTKDMHHSMYAPSCFAYKKTYQPYVVFSVLMGKFSFTASQLGVLKLPVIIGSTSLACRFLPVNFRYTASDQWRIFCAENNMHFCNHYFSCAFNISRSSNIAPTATNKCTKKRLAPVTRPILL